VHDWVQHIELKENYCSPFFTGLFFCQSGELNLFAVGS